MSNLQAGGEQGFTMNTTRTTIAVSKEARQILKVKAVKKGVKMFIAANDALKSWKTDEIREAGNRAVEGYTGTKRKGLKNV
jgi:hypothetical protein